MRLIALLLLTAAALLSCALPPAPGEAFRAGVVDVVSIKNLQPHGSLVAAVREGVGLTDAWELRVLLVSCLPSPGGVTDVRLAIAPPEIRNVHRGDHLLVRVGSGDAVENVSRVVSLLPPPTAQQRAPDRWGHQAVLCQAAGQTLHVTVSTFYWPLEILQAELQLREPLRGLSRDDLDAGRIVRLSCHLAEETNPLVWFARLPPGLVVEPGQQVEAIGGRYDLEWSGGPLSPLSRVTPQKLRTFAEQHWRVELSRVTRVIDRNRSGTPPCRNLP